MTTARTLLRFVLAGVMVNMLAAACVVNSDGGDDDDETCEPNSTKDCTCTDGTESTRKCNASGTAYGSCACDGSGTGGSGTGNEGGAPATGQAGDSNTAGTTTYGGESGTTGGVPNGDGGTPSTPGEGGAGGSGEVDPGLCAEDPSDTCADCYQQGCCAQWTACVEDESDTCLTEFTNIIACAEVIKEDHNVTTGEFEQCAADESTAGGGWSNGLSALTIDMVNCVAGEDEGGWEGMAWGSLSCKAGCFDAQ